MTMTKIFISTGVAVSLLIGACNSTGHTTTNDQDTVNAQTNGADGVHNSLSNGEREAGWMLLFNGKDMEQWRVFQNKPGNTWSVKDGTLYCKGSTTDKSDLRADIITKDQFENFELEIDWKISKGGNSGLIYLVSEQAKATYRSGPEYQMIDDIGYPGKLEDWQKTAANYAMNAAPDAKPKPAGEWNNTRIIVNKGKVEHWLNGDKVVEYELWTDDWKANKEKGKWKDTPEYGTFKSGHIALQDHGSEAWFRNIKIRKL